MISKYSFSSIWIIVVLLIAASSDSVTKNWLEKGKCKGIWRSDKLPGRCFGLLPHDTYPELKHIPKVESSADCRALCCNLDDKCVTWQYEATSKVCRLGDKVRLGMEGGGTPLWCDPLPPAAWYGRRIVSKSRKAGTCDSSEEILTAQCFGLGAERLNSTKGRMDTKQCEEACCTDRKCNIWQEMAGRGCYFSDDSDKIACKNDRPNAVFDGGRKCVPGHCGGLESKILLMGNAESSSA
jgi:hypothetical protein